MSESNYYASVPVENAPVAMVADPEVLFGAEHLHMAETDPVPNEAIFALVDQIEASTKPSPFASPNGAPLVATPKVSYVSSSPSEKGLSLTYYRYETEAAYTETTLRDDEGRPLLATIKNYGSQPTFEGAPAVDTLCIDRAYRAFVLRETEVDGAIVSATAPASWNDVTLAFNRLHNKVPRPPKEALTVDQAEVQKRAAAHIADIKNDLSGLPAFREAVADRLYAYVDKPSEEAIDQLVQSFWEGNHTAPSDDPNQPEDGTTLLVDMGAHHIELQYRRELAHTDHDGKDGVTVSEMIDLVVRDAPETAPWREIALHTGKPTLMNEAMAYIERVDEDGNRVLAKQLVSGHNPIEDIDAQIAEVRALLALPPTELIAADESLEDILDDDAFLNNLSRDVFGNGNKEYREIPEIPNETVEAIEESLRPKPIFYPGVDDAYIPPMHVPTPVVRMRSRAESSAPAEQKPNRIVAALRRLGIRLW